MRKFWMILLILCFQLSSLMMFSVDALAQKDTLIIGKQDDTASLDPAKGYEAGAWVLLWQMYETLVTFEGDNYIKPVPGLAESWELSEDGKTWIFHIRKNTQFSTGNPVNADAVVYSLHRAIALANPSSWVLTQFGLTEQTITKIDEYTVQMMLNKPYAPELFLACLIPPVASILDPVIVKEHEQNNDWGSAWLEEHSAGSGPFVMGEQVRNKSYVLERNTFYQRGIPKFNRVIVKVVPEPVEQMLQLQERQIDVALNLQPDQVQELVNTQDIRIFDTLSFFFTFIGMNNAYPPLGNSNVRKAIRYAVDYDRIISNILQGTGEKIQTFIPKGLFGYWPETPYTHNIEKAKQLLVEAGYPEGFDVELKCLNYSPWIDLALQLKKNLGDIGIKVTINQGTGAKLMPELFSSRKEFQMYVWEWGFDYPDPDALAKSIAHSDSPGDDATIQAVAWWCNYVNLQTSKLVEQAASELDSDKRQALYRQIQEIILDDGPLAILYTQTYQHGVRSEVADRISFPSIIWVPFPILK
ncbi:ABC-type dipeptide transport system, periplasmic component [Candidatus Moduliflexus flocculans]|uniref:ABC-type dipeptide transport system, periplasmic component n=1 Tax=Candidatus Moduliflexus flocculans TaxID=1499966 RepID=A0A081BM31_9BACT|nr:ABC-type dipeptide transport system, periplasmic component [Candidatus Moduliflexus flocculans]